MTWFPTTPGVDLPPPTCTHSSPATDRIPGFSSFPPPRLVISPRHRHVILTFHSSFLLHEFITSKFDLSLIVVILSSKSFLLFSIQLLSLFEFGISYYYVQTLFQRRNLNGLVTKVTSLIPSTVTPKRARESDPRFFYFIFSRHRSGRSGYKSSRRRGGVYFFRFSWIATISCR